LRSDGGVTARGGDYDSWDIEVRGGALGSARLRALVEEHGAGKQLARVRSWPRWAPVALATSVLFCALALAAGFGHAWAASAVLGFVGIGVAARAALESASAMLRFDRALGDVREILDRQRL
ncbi:MAG TPA: hypothetical protein VHS56_11540, partial [Candidatus Cybelea sp.]|nr:hypothetical protein [Candidatus Cybelea sp.]